MNDFDMVCGYFQELSKQANVDKMSHLERNDFIVSKINKNLPDKSNAKSAWQAILPLLLNSVTNYINHRSNLF